MNLHERDLNYKSSDFKKLRRHLITLHYIHEALKIVSEIIIAEALNYTLPEMCTHNHQISVHSCMLQNIWAYICLIQLSYTLFYFT